jgi:hypothetical protein
LAPAFSAEGVDVFVLGDVDGLQESLEQVGDGAGGFGFYIAADDGGDEARQGGAEIAGGEVVAGEEVGQVFAEFFCGTGLGFFLGVVRAEAGIFAGAGVRQRRPSEKVNEHRDTRSFAEREDMKVSLELSFGITGLKRTQAEACATKRKRPGKAGAQFATGILYHEGKGNADGNGLTARFLSENTLG